MPLPSFCDCAGWFESTLVPNPEDRFSRDVAPIWKAYLWQICRLLLWFPSPPVPVVPPLPPPRLTAASSDFSCTSTTQHTAQFNIWAQDTRERPKHCAVWNPPNMNTQPPGGAGVSVSLCETSYRTSLYYVSEERRLWQDCADDTCRLTRAFAVRLSHWTGSFTTLSDFAKLFGDNSEMSSNLRKQFHILYFTILWCVFLWNQSSWWVDFHCLKVFGEKWQAISIKGPVSSMTISELNIS